MNNHPSSGTRTRSKLHFRKRLIFIGLTSHNSGGQRFDIGTSDQQPEHDCHLGEERWLQPGKSGFVINREELCGKAERYPGEAGDDQPDAEEARQKSGAKDKQAKRKEPHAPENLIDELSLTVQTQEKHGERVALWFVEHRKKLAAAKKNDRRDVVQSIEKTDRGGNQNKRHHQHRPGLVHAV